MVTFAFGRAARALSAAVLAAGLAGCAQIDAPATVDDTATPVHGGHLTWGVTTEPTCFDPRRTTQTNGYMLERNYIDSLVSKEPDGGFGPWLAKSWTVSADGTVYTFRLRDDVAFTDGTKFDAAAVKANLDDVVAPKNAENSATYLQSYAGASVVSPDTVRVRLKHPDSSFLESLSSVQLGMLSPKSLKLGDALCGGGKSLSGTGPFEFGSYQRGQSVTLVRNPDYDWAPTWAQHQGPAYLDSVTIRFLPEDVVRSGALSSGQVDVIEGVQSTDVSAFKGQPGFQFLDGPSSNTAFTLNLNYTRGVLKDIRVRRAIRDGFDLDTAVKSLYLGHYDRAWSNIGPDDAESDKKLVGAWGDDVAKANAELDAAGWTGRDSDGYRTKDGKRLRVEVGYPEDYVRDHRDVLIQGIQAELKKNVGIDLDLKIITIGEFTSQETNGTWSIYPNTMNPGDTALMETQLIGPTGFLYQAIKKGNDQTLYSWMARSLQTKDRAERERLVDQIQQRAVDRAYIVPLYAPTSQLAATTLVHGLGFDPNLDTPASAYDFWKERS